MNRLNTNQKGFSAVEVLAVILIVVVIGAVGWVLVNKRNNATPQNDVSTKTQAPVADAACEIEKTWKVATSHNKYYSICVPGGWTMTVDSESDAFLAVPPFAIDDNKSAVIKRKLIGGKDGSADAFRIFKTEEAYVGWVDQDTAQQTVFTLADGTEGTRYYSKAAASTARGIGPVEGEENYEYVFAKNELYVHVVYTVLPGTENRLEAVERVIKTLAIN